MTDLQIGDLVRVINPHSSVASVGDTGVVKDINTDRQYAQVSPVVTKEEWLHIFWFMKQELEKIE